jgi:hypothetical protein
MRFSKSIPPNCRRYHLSSRNWVLFISVWSFLLLSYYCCTGGTLWHLLKFLQYCCRIFKQENRTPRLFRKKYLLGVLAAAQWIHFQRLNPENEEKEALPHTLLQAGYRSEKQSLIHIWLLVISLVTSSSVLCDCFQVQFLPLLSPT